MNEVHIDLLYNKQVFIDGYRGLLEYGDEMIRVLIGRKTLCITGCGLYLEKMTENTLCICGEILAVAFE